MICIEENLKHNTKEYINNLVERGKLGDEVAIQAIIEQYKPFVIKQCYKYKIPSYDFEDLMQYSYISIIRAIKLYNFGNVSFTSYVMRAISNNLAYLLRKSVKFYRECQGKESFTMDYADEDFIIDGKLIEQENLKELKEALGALKDKDREIVEDYYFKRIPMLVIAEKEGCTYDGVRKKKKRVLRKLKNHINR